MDTISVDAVIRILIKARDEMQDEQVNEEHLVETSNAETVAEISETIYRKGRAYGLWEGKKKIQKIIWAIEDEARKTKDYR